MPKKKIQEECIEKEISQSRAGKIIRVSQPMISKWLSQYEEVWRL